MFTRSLDLGVQRFSFGLHYPVGRFHLQEVGFGFFGPLSSEIELLGLCPVESLGLLDPNRESSELSVDQVQAF